MVDIREAKDENAIERIGELAHRIWHEHYTPIIGKDQVDYMVKNFQSIEAIKGQMDEGYRYFMVYAKDYTMDEDTGTNTTEREWPMGGHIPIGYFAVLSMREDNSLFISKFYIEKAHRGKGIARLCLNYMEDLAEEEGLGKLWLTVNKYNSGSIAAYESMGLRKTEELVQDIGGGFVMDDYRMEKNL